MDDLIEDAYIAAANSAKNNYEIEEAFGGLGRHYLHLLDSQGDDLDVAKRAAFFLYKSYLAGNKYSLEYFQDVVNKYKLDVDTSDINAWGKREGLYH